MPSTLRQGAERSEASIATSAALENAMDRRTYHQQMSQLRPHEPADEFSSWDNFKFTSLGWLGLVAVVALPVLVIAGLITVVAGLLR